jgi:hypothetical protein
MRTVGWVTIQSNVSSENFMYFDLFYHLIASFFFSSSFHSFLMLLLFVDSKGFWRWCPKTNNSDFFYFFTIFFFFYSSPSVSSVSCYITFFFLFSSSCHVPKFQSITTSDMSDRNTRRLHARPLARRRSGFSKESSVPIDWICRLTLLRLEYGFAENWLQYCRGLFAGHTLDSVCNWHVLFQIPVLEMCIKTMKLISSWA